MGKEIKGKSPILLGASRKELEALVEGTRKVSEDQKKFKTLTSPPSGSRTPMRIKVPKRLSNYKGGGKV